MMEQLEMLALEKIGPLALFILLMLAINNYTVFRIVKMFLDKK